jgi:prepilin-type N-terminal cleavage/methylation domain-containing protein
MPHILKKLNSFSNKNQKGFTLIELVICSIVISIIIIFLVSMLQKVNMKARDALRLSDMATLYQAIQVKIHNTEAEDKLYYILCSQVKTPCEGSSFPISGTTRRIDGSGWLRIIFSKKELLKYTILPLDPLNNAEYKYTYFSDGKMWKMETKLEAESNKKKMENDGGEKPDKYEVFVKLK